MSARSVRLRPPGSGARLDPAVAVASRWSHPRHPSRPAPPWLVRWSRIARCELAPLNRCAPLPAARCDGGLRTAAAGRHPRDRGRTDSAGALDVPDRAACASARTLRSRKSGKASLPRRVSSVRSSCHEFARTVRAAWHMRPRGSGYSTRERKSPDAKTDFRRAAPAAPRRHVECARNLTRQGIGALCHGRNTSRAGPQ
jgi:hypothetical protein